MIADQLILNKKENKTTYQDDKTSEKPIRSIAKAFSWRVIGTVDTLIISYILFHISDAGSGSYSIIFWGMFLG